MTTQEASQIDGKFPPFSTSTQKSFEECRDICNTLEEVLNPEEFDPTFMALLQQLIIGGGPQTIHEQLRQRKRFLEEGAEQIRVYVAGEVAVGKTTLINLLMGNSYLPTGHNRCTGVVCEVAHSPDKAAWIYYDSDPDNPEYLELENNDTGPNWDRIKKLIVEKEDTNGKTIKKVEMYWPFKIFDRGDSPISHRSGHTDEDGQDTALTFENNISPENREDKRRTLGKPPVCFMDFPGIEEDDDESFRPYKDNLNRCHSFLFVLDVSRTDGVHRTTILKLMYDLNKKLETEGIEFNPEASLFICTGLPKNIRDDKREKLKKEILKKLKSIWCMVSEEQIIFINIVDEPNLVELKEILLKFLENADRLLLEEIFSWLSNLLETTCALIRNGLKSMESTKHREQVQKLAEKYFKHLTTTMDEELTEKGFTGKMKQICGEKTLIYERKLKELTEGMNQTFNTLNIQQFLDILKLKDLVQIVDDFETSMTEEENRLKEKIRNNAFGKMIGMFSYGDQQRSPSLLATVATVIVTLPVAKFVFLMGVAQALWEEYKNSPPLTKDRCIQLAVDSRFSQVSYKRINSFIEDLDRKRQVMIQIRNKSLDKIIKANPQTVEQLEELISKLWDMYVGNILRHEINVKDVTLGERINKDVYKALVTTDGHKMTLAMKEIEDTIRVKRRETIRKEEGVLQRNYDVNTLPCNTQIYREVVLLRLLSKKRDDEDFQHFVQYRGSAFKVEKNIYSLYIFTKLYTRSLRDVIKAESYPDTPAVSKLMYAYHAARGLRFIHRNGIIHRDVKPENFLVDDNDTVVICDVGHSKSLNTARTFVGTSQYFAPEVKRDKVHIQKSDIYSLGLVFAELFYRTDPTVPIQVIPEREDRKLLDMDRPYGLVRMCLEQSPNKRPDINHVVSELNKIIYLYSIRQSQWVVEK